MSIIERIQQIQHAQEEQAARERVLNEIASEKERILKEEAERPQREREQFVLQQTEKVLKESGIVNQLQQIEKDLLNKEYPNHALVVIPTKYWGENNPDFSSDTRVRLVWGRYGSIFEVHRNGNVIANYDYCAIDVAVNPDTEELTIMGEYGHEQKLGRTEWSDKDKLEISIAKSFTSPRVHESAGPQDE